MHMMIKLLSTLQYCIKPSTFVYDVIAAMFHPVLDYQHGNILLQYGEFVLENITLLMNVQYKCKATSNFPCFV